MTNKKMLVFLWLMLLSVSAKLPANDDTLSVIDITPEHIVASLMNGLNDSEIIAKKLNLVTPIYRFDGVKGFLPCKDFKEAKINYVSLYNGISSAIITAKDRLCERQFIIVISKMGNSWVVAKTIPLVIKHVEPTISYKSLVSDKDKEIVVENYETDSGTGIQQSNIAIWKLMSPSRLELVLEAPTNIHFELIGNEEFQHKANFEESNQYHFFEAPIRLEPDAATCRIERHQVIIKYKNKIERWMRYCWDSEIGRFQSYHFTR